MTRMFLRSITRGSILLLSGFLSSCGSSTEVPEEPELVRGPEWVESSHGQVTPDTAAAFPAAVRRAVVLSVSSQTWSALNASMQVACGPIGTASATCTGSGLDAFPDVSAWHEGSLLADGQVWSDVGFRLRSNSELADAWKTGTGRFPFRITMDKFEDVHPTIRNQRFYGFKKLALASLADDSTLLRHQIASAVYRAQGVPTVQGTLVDLRIAHGTDTSDLGVYSLREAPDAPLLDRWFGSGGGNLYEPTSRFVGYVADDFEDGENDGTRTDILALFGALDAANRTTEPASWRASLRSVFDVDGFVAWLAVSTAMGDHGSYGYEPSGYALYADDGRLRWMALDADLSMPGGSAIQRNVWHLGAATSWPLIAKVLADSSFCADYAARLKSLVSSDGPVRSSAIDAAISSKMVLLDGLADRESRVAPLRVFAAGRAAVVDSSVANHPCPWTE